MSVLISKCCGVDLTLNQDDTHVWVECMKCKTQENKLTHKEFMARIRKFIDEPDEDELRKIKR